MLLICAFDFPHAKDVFLMMRLIFNRMVRCAAAQRPVHLYPAYNKKLYRVSVVRCVQQLKMSLVSVYMMMLHIRLVTCVNKVICGSRGGGYWTPPPMIFQGIGFEMVKMFLDPPWSEARPPPPPPPPAPEKIFWICACKFASYITYVHVYHVCHILQLYHIVSHLQI